MRANDAGGGRTGPYWRRQMGTTLPGERTQAQLNLINKLLARRGLPPMGGQRRAIMPEDQRQMLPPEQLDPMRGAFPMPPQPEVSADFGPGSGHLVDMPHPQEAQALPADHDIEALRQRLLASVQRQAFPTPGRGREALRKYAQQAQLRRAQPGPMRPILPPRPPMRRATPRPY